jgi:hypothetical protein
MATSKTLFSNAAIGCSGQILNEIHQKNKNIAVYERDCQFLEQELSYAMTQQVSFKTNGSLDEILERLAEYFQSNLSSCIALLEDIKNLTIIFAGISKSDSYRLYFNTVNHDMCRKFHTDINDLRLLCTYFGKGTLWVPEEAVSYGKLYDEKNIVDVDFKQVQQAKSGDVIILKGALYPEANPILHRSPAIEKIREKRLLLRIDTSEFLNF